MAVNMRGKRWHLKVPTTPDLLLVLDRIFSPRVNGNIAIEQGITWEVTGPGGKKAAARKKKTR